MNITEPPFQFDDTQPHRAQKKRALGASQGLLLLIIGTSLLLLLSFVGVVLYQPLPAAQPLYTVYFHHAGIVEQLETPAQTVGDFVASQRIMIAADDTLSPPAETLLYDGMEVWLNTGRLITLTLNGEMQTITTTHTNPYDILQAQQISLEATDRIWLDGTQATQNDLITWPVPVNEIVLQRPLSITIHDGDATITLETTAQTIGEALFEAEITLYLADRVVPVVDEVVTAQMQIRIERAVPVTILVDDTVVESRTQGKTVGEAVAESGITLMGLDYTIPSEIDPLVPDTQIQVVRVTEDLLQIEESLPHETLFQADSNIPLDERSNLQSGQDGLQVITARVRYEDGIEVARDPINVEVVREPVAHIIGYGTQIVLRTIDTPEGSREYWRVLRVYATSYHPAALGGDNSTATGDLLQKGIIAADPSLISYGTQLYVPDYGLGIMADTGSKRANPYWIDLGYSDDDYTSWHWPVDIYLLAPVPDSIDYILPGR